ncbi:MAG: type II secretion system F family protein [Eubacterium sp.]
MTGSVISIILITVSFTLLVFIVAFIIAYLTSSNKIASDKRLEELKKKEGESDDVALVKSESKQTLRRKNRKNKNSFFEKMGSALYKELQAADIKMRPEEFMTIWIIVSVVPAGLVAMFINNVTVSLALVAAGVVLPFFIIKNKQKSRVKKFDNQLSDALMIACSSLKSGLSFTQAMETIAKDMDDPISSEFTYVIQEINMGTSMDEALENMGKRIKSSYLSLMISAVLVQRQTGGNLSQILENIAKSIKEKMKIKQELKSATASGKMSGMMVGCMPVIMLVLFSVINFEFIEPLFTTSLGHIFLGIAAGLEVVCFAIIRKITNVKM